MSGTKQRYFSAWLIMLGGGELKFTYTTEDTIKGRKPTVLNMINYHDLQTDLGTTYRV